MARPLSAQQETIATIFGSGRYVFFVPGYQRPYSWTVEQAQELFDDVLTFMRTNIGDHDDETPYFLGSIVLIKDEGRPESQVIDGQQRLTTLALLLAAIRCRVDVDSGREITGLIYERGSAILGTQDRYRLTLRERDEKFFQRYVQQEGGIGDLIASRDKLTDSCERLRENARLFDSRLSAIDTEERLRLAQFLVQRCVLVVVATPDVESAYRIFSVLNSRGLDLTATDILKADIIGRVPESLRDEATQKWEDTEDDLGREAFENLFSHIRMVYRKSKPQSTLLKEFKEHVTEVTRPILFIDSVLLPMAAAFQAIADSAYESTANAAEVNEHLVWLNRLEFKDWVPPALAFMSRHRNDPTRVSSFFRDLERLGYFLLVTRAAINERIERCSSLTAWIEKGESPSMSESPLQLTPEEQHEFFTALDGPLYSLLSARACSTVLQRLDRLISAGGAHYDYETITVEHVLPQNPAETSVWLKWWPEAVERSRWVHRLGNLALLTRKKNSSAQNYDFEVKKDKYFRKSGVSPFALTTQVLNEASWTLDAVKARQGELVARLEDHWKLGDRRVPVA